MKIQLFFSIFLYAALYALEEPLVLNGIDVLAKDQYAPLKGHTIGLITNHTGHDYLRTSTIDLLYKAPGITLKALFSPEHGIRGILDTHVNDSKDEKTGLPIYSLYGATRIPQQEQLKGLTALVFDIQDIGCRFYTYISTLGHCMEAAAKAQIKFFVLDRINPINGITVEGPVLADTPSFTAYYAIPVRHGMTVGELACMFNEEKKLGLDLVVIQAQGWKREQWFDQTGLAWTNPSPNMRSLIEATLYPGIGLLEKTALSVGRGTDTPFEVIGAPYINEMELIAELRKVDLKGVTFVPVQFTPKASIFKNELCKGINIIVLNRNAYSPTEVGLTIASILYKLYPEHLNFPCFNTLLCHPDTLKAIENKKSVNDIRALWNPALEEFYKRRMRYLIYK